MTASVTVSRTAPVSAVASVGSTDAGGAPHVAALDGLRGVAVAAVVAYHVRPDLVPGGFLGVDVFFVLSGYLITSLLLAEHRRTGRIDLAAFVRRRVRRLLPALFVVVAASVVWGALVLEGAELDRLREQVWSTCTYLTNWQLVATGESYFGAFVVPSPLRHAWSLAVEEQFYLVWPLTVVVVARWGRRAVGVVALVAAGISAVVLAATFDAADPSRAYFGTDSRILEPLIGAALAAAAPLARVAHPDRIAALRLPVARRVGGVVVAGTGLVLAAAFLGADDRGAAYYRGGAVAVAVASGLLVVALAADVPGARVLAWRPLVAVGTISYGIYLWHWPVLVAVRHAEPDPGTAASLAAVGASVALAAASYHLLERPVRRHRRLASGSAGAGRLTVAMALVPALALVAAAGIVLRPATPADATS
ncbi:MAG: acyltransferase, partial [Actinomyces sp.]